MLTQRAGGGASPRGAAASRAPDAAAAERWLGWTKREAKDAKAAFKAAEAKEEASVDKALRAGTLAAGAAEKAAGAATAAAAAAEAVGATLIGIGGGPGGAGTAAGSAAVPSSNQVSLFLVFFSTLLGGVVGSLIVACCVRSVRPLSQRGSFC